MLTHELIHAKQKASRRLLIMLHGLGDSIEGYRWMPQVMNLPWLNFLLVNAPDEYYGGFSWYNFNGDILPGVERSRRLLVEILDDQLARGLASDQIVLGGFSQGCLMAIEVGLRYPHRLAGILGISGYVSSTEALLGQLSPVGKEQRLLMTHGTFDPLIPIQMVRQQVKALQAGGVNVAWHEFVKEHTIAGEQELAVIREFVRGCFGPDL
jgi:phospholipase/carboxylesterase